MHDSKSIGDQICVFEFAAPAQRYENLFLNYQRDTQNCGIGRNYVFILYIFFSFLYLGNLFPLRMKQGQTTIEGWKTSIAEEADFRLSSDDRIEKMLALILT